MVEFRPSEAEDLLTGTPDPSLTTVYFTDVPEGSEAALGRCIGADFMGGRFVVTGATHAAVSAMLRQEREFRPRRYDEQTTARRTVSAFILQSVGLKPSAIEDTLGASRATIARSVSRYRQLNNAVDGVEAVARSFGGGYPYLRVLAAAPCDFGRFSKREIAILSAITIGVSPHRAASAEADHLRLSLPSDRERAHGRHRFHASNSYHKLGVSGSQSAALLMQLVVKRPSPAG